MTSKIIVNNIEADSGISSITFNDSIFIGDINSTGTSTFNVISGVSTIGVTTVHLTGINDLNYPTVGPLSNRNLIVNGAMQVAQRGTSSTSTGTGYYTVDRFITGLGGSGGVTYSQSTDSPQGFGKSFKIDIDTADTLSGSEEFYFEQRIEAQNLQHLDYGTSSSKTLTLSFWVKSYQTGQFSAWFYQPDSTRVYFKEYTVNASGTWEYKTVTIPGDASGVINDDNETGLHVRFYLGAGPNRVGTVPTNWSSHTSADRVSSNQVQLTNNTDNYWAITGIQLELGSVATPFEHRSYGDELARCQRYHYNGGQVRQYSAGYSVNARGAGSWISFPVTMRDTATVTQSGITYSGANTAQVHNASAHGFTSYFISQADNTTWCQFTYVAEKEL